MDADTIIIGGGVVGLWTANHLVSQGTKTILFEQFPYPHTRGSSHGQSRITRTSYVDEEYSAMMPEAHRQWRDLEKHSGKQLMIPMGLVSLYNTKENNVSYNAMLCNLKKYGIKHHIVDGENVEKNFPGLVSNFDQKAIFDGEAGLLRADSCLIALQNWYKELGGDIHDGERVISLNPITDTKIEVKTSKNTYICKSVVLTCGAYINDILSTVNFKVPIQAEKALVCYWRSKNDSQYSLTNGFPATIVYGKTPAHLYSLPSYEYPGLIKICYHGGSIINPNRRDELTPEIEKKESELLAWLKEKIKLHFKDVDTSSPAIREFCMYTQSPDHKNILDFHPKHKNIVIGTGFSGSGFKTSPTVGRILASMASGRQSPYPLTPFSLDRFNPNSKL